MNNFKLLFAVLFACALATASVNKNLRYLDEQNEREMDESGSADAGNESSPQTTPEATTTKDETTTQPTTTTSSSSEPDGGETTTPGDVTTTKSSDEPLPSNRFFCVSYSKTFADHKGYNVSEITCIIPKPEGVVSEKPIISIKNGDTDVVIPSSIAEDNSKFKLTLQQSIEVLTNHVTVTSNWSNVINTTELYLGCRLGNTYYKNEDKVEGDNIPCPSPLNTDITFNGTCNRNEENAIIGTEKEYEFVFGEKSDICECASSVEVKGHKIDLTTTDLNFGNKTNLPCKGPGEQTEIICSVAGWVTSTSDEISSCTLNDAASFASISSFLFGIVVLVILTIF